MQHYARIVNDVAAERIDISDGLKIGVDIFSRDFAAALVSCDATVKEGDVWDPAAKTWSAPPPPPAPPVPDITRAQARIQLHRANLLEKVEEAVQAAGGEVAIWYADAAIWQRKSPYIAQIGGALTPPLSSTDIDGLFRAAAQIQV